MIEYPSIINSSKAPRRPMIAFDKIDGSNIRIKWTKKKGFNLYGSRTQLFDSSHPTLGGCVGIFGSRYQTVLEEFFIHEYKKENEIIIFGEYYGPNSFAGIHTDPIEKMDFYLFDILFIRKGYNEFLLPQHFLKIRPQFESIGIPMPKIVHEGNLTDDFIRRVRRNDFNLNEGVVCKGTEKLGSFRGKQWMCKIKTDDYRMRLMERYKKDWEQYYE
jgi:ATP-dependent RNA circularization protein (DNA/RNA ligase family)